jgi:hypothetical protein
MNTKVSVKRLTKAAGIHMSITGNAVEIIPHPTESTVMLRIKLPNGSEAGIGYYPNHVAESVLSALNFYDGAIKHDPDKVVIYAQQAPASKIAVDPATLFVQPEKARAMKTPMLDKESYYKIVEMGDQDLLCNMLNSFQRHIDYMVRDHAIVNPTEEFQMDVGAVKRYLDVFGRNGMWSDKRALKNIIILLKKYRAFVMEGIDQQYLLGRKIFPAALNVPLV